MAASILIHDWCGHPFTLDLSKELAGRGYSVHYVYTRASGGPKAAIVDSSDSLALHHVDVDPIQKSRFVRRWFQDRAYGARAARIVARVRPDVVISANTPLESQRKIINACRRKNIPFIFWQQDIISIAARSILTRRSRILGGLVGGYFYRLEKKMLRQSRHIIVIADEFKEIITGWGIAPDKVDVIANWAPIADIPVLAKRNAFAEKYHLSEKIVVLYSGTMGMKHNPQMIRRLARYFADDARIQFVVATDGVGRQALEEGQRKQNLSNLLLLPLQPFEIFPQVLASADILLVLLENDAGIFSVPSKVWSGYCAARPTLLAAPPGNLAARLTRDIGAGLAVRPDDFDGAVFAILDLARDAEKRKSMGQNARRFAEEHFPAHKVAARFEKVIKRVDNRFIMTINDEQVT